MKPPTKKECCKDCFVPSHDVTRGHVDVAVPESCGDEDCPCHRSPDAEKCTCPCHAGGRQWHDLCCTPSAPPDANEAHVFSAENLKTLMEILRAQSHKVGDRIRYQPKAYSRDPFPPDAMEGDFSEVVDIQLIKLRNEDISWDEADENINAAHHKALSSIRSQFILKAALREAIEKLRRQHIAILADYDIVFGDLLSDLGLNEQV